jgi:hypothetical protein
MLTPFLIVSIFFDEVTSSFLYCMLIEFPHIFNNNSSNVFVNISFFSPVNCNPPPPPPPPPPASRVKFIFQDGRCLVTNSSGVPCASMPYTLCHVFLGDCNSLSAEWDDGNNGIAGHYLTSLANNNSYSNAINIDCNSCAIHSVAKLLPGSSSASDIVFSNGQLVYTRRSSYLKN